MRPEIVNWTLNCIEQSHSDFSHPMDMRGSISQIKALPPLPGTALQILSLTSDPNADAEKLAEIIEIDPLLTAQIIRWSSSPLYGYSGKICSVKDAIVKVMGFDFVRQLALGLSVMVGLQCPRNGVIGTRMFWIHALASTRLMKKLADQMPATEAPDTQEVFMAGLLHNIGFPLFGHLFPNEFKHLLRVIDANPQLTIFNLETFIMGINHSMIGAWLMQSWAMPQSITDVVYHHHNPRYQGDNYRLNLLTYLNDHLLGQIQIGDGTNQPCPQEVLTLLGLSIENCQIALDSLPNEIQAISAMADSMTR